MLEKYKIPTLLGATAACIAFVASGGGTGLFSNLIGNLSIGVAGTGIGDFYYQKLAKIKLSNEDFDSLNHDLERAFQRATIRAIDLLEFEYIKYYRLQISQNLFEIHLLKIKAFFKEWRREIKVENDKNVTDDEIIKPYIFEDSNKGLDYISERYIMHANDKSSYFLDFTKLNFFKILDTCFFEELKEDTKSYRAFVILHLKKTNHIVSSIDSNVQKIQKSIYQIKKNPKINKLNTGKLLYDIPQKMILHKVVKCTILIAYNEEIIKKVKEYNKDAILEDVKITNVMQTDLLDLNHSKAFEITPLNTNEQFLEKEDATKWVFNVKPIKEGKHILYLKIAAVLVISNKERKKQIVLEIKIEVTTNSNGNEVANDYATNYWVSSNININQYFSLLPSIVYSESREIQRHIKHTEYHRKHVDWKIEDFDNSRKYKTERMLANKKSSGCIWPILLIILVFLIYLILK